MTYEAIIAKLDAKLEHPNADRLAIYSVCGRRIVAGLDHEVGEVGVFFGDDGILDDEFCRANDLYPRFDENGVRIGGGFFSEKKARVRAQSFRGQKSEGFWMPLECLTYVGLSLEEIKRLLPIGSTFSELNGHKIATKFYTKATLAQLKSTGKAQKEIKGFPKQIDTKQLAYYNYKIKAGAIISISAKLHGTSARTGKVPVTENIKQTWIQKLFKRTPKTTTNFKVVTGTRNVVLKDGVTQGGYYGDDSFRFEAADRFAPFLHKNEVIYYELVGYYNDKNLIMPAHDTSKLKEIKKQYGPSMAYTYGAAQGQCKVFIYRIAFVNEDGISRDLSWNQVKTRSIELGLETVPELVSNVIVHRIDKEYGPMIDFEYEEMPLIEVAKLLGSGASILDHRHIEEGVVVRVENPDGEVFWLKDKSFEFKVLEGIIKDSDDYVDMEEIS